MDQNVSKKWTPPTVTVDQLHLEELAKELKQSAAQVESVAERLANEDSNLLWTTGNTLTKMAIDLEEILRDP